MKKIHLILTLIFFIFSSSFSHAQDVVFEKGDIDFLNGETQISVDFVYDNMKVGELTEAMYLKQKKMEFRKPADQDKYLKQWEIDKTELFENGFIKNLNSGLKKLELTAVKDADSRYTMRVVLVKLEPGYFTGASDKRNSYVNFQIQMVETDKPDKVLCVLIGDKLLGLSDNATLLKETSYRIKIAFENAGDKTGKCMAKMVAKKEKEINKEVKKKEDVLPFEKEEKEDANLDDDEEIEKENGKKTSKEKPVKDDKEQPKKEDKKKGNSKIDDELDG